MPTRTLAGIASALLIVVVAACDSEPPTGTGLFADRPPVAPGPEPGSPLPFLTAEQRARFDQGSGVFSIVFTPEMGLGPLFNSSGCAKCHFEPVPGGVGVEVVQHASALQGGVCNDLSDKGGPVIQKTVTRALHDALGIYQVPVPPEATATARRTTPGIWGAGLLDGVPEAEILALADAQRRRGDGIAGRPNLTADGRLGRFGRKGQVATLNEFIADAFINEMGITSPKFPTDKGVGGNPVPPGVDTAPDPEISQEQLDATDAFLRFLAAPTPVGPAMVQVQGRQIFTQVGCAGCHVPELRTGPNPVAALSNQVVPAYTDLLLHDMGPGLADICLGKASPVDFRTEPLWGLRFRFAYLHDGRAKTLEQAIRLHAGEATSARDRFVALSPGERAMLLRFLGNL